MRFVPEVFDEVVQVRDGHTERGAVLRDDIFLDHDAAGVIRAWFLISF